MGEVFLHQHHLLPIGSFALPLLSTKGEVIEEAEAEALALVKETSARMMRGRRRRSKSRSWLQSGFFKRDVIMLLVGEG